MKNIIYNLALLLLLSVAGLSCKKSELFTYQGKADIYFDAATKLPGFNGEVITDSTIVSFAYSTVQDSISKIIIGVTGAMKDYDRSYKLQVSPVSTAVAGKHYDFISTDFVIKKNTLKDTLFLNLHRTKDMQSTEPLLILHLEENDSFVTSMRDKLLSTTTGKKMSYVTYKVYVNDIIKKPSGWFDFYLGTFSRKKLFLMVDVLSVEPSFFIGTPSLGILLAYGKFMQRYLNEMKAAGKTIYEEDGTEMIMGTEAQ
jgi:hypothetical protein